jgi:hypothetical protein
VLYENYNGVVLEPDEGIAIAKTLGDKKVFISLATSYGKWLTVAGCIAAEPRITDDRRDG